MIENMVWMIFCVYFEARGEPLEGQKLVAHSIMNRAYIRGLSLEKIVRQSKQYSWYNGGYIPIIMEPKELPACTTAVIKTIAARSMGMKGGGVTHFYSQDIKAPYWAASMKPLGQIGKHLFFKEM